MKPPIWSKGSRPLNEKLRACSPPDAVFEEKTGRDYQEVEAYEACAPTQPPTTRQFLAKTLPSDQTTTMDKKEREARTKHFEEKAKWKELPGNRYDMRKAEKPPKLDFHFDKELAGFTFPWA